MNRLVRVFSQEQDMSHNPNFVGEKMPMRPITRRDFVGKSAVAAGLLAVVKVWTTVVGEVAISMSVVPGV